jgi:hypothetical protein
MYIDRGRETQWGGSRGRLDGLISVPHNLEGWRPAFRAPCRRLRQIFRLHGHESETLFAGIAEHGFEVTEEGEPGAS